MTSAAADAARLAGLPCLPDQVDAFLGAPPPSVLPVVAALPGPILVLGAGGKMGLHLSIMLRRALDAQARPDDAIVAVSRFGTLRDRASFEQFGIKTLACDLADEAALRALPEAPTIFYLAGAKFGTAADPGLLQRANVAMPRQVAQRFRTARIVAFSSGCVYPFVRPESAGATEETPLRPVGEYAQSCVAREGAFVEAAARYGTRVLLVRLSYSVEFRYGVLVDIAQQVLRDEPIDVTMGYASIIWQRDAVAHVIQAAALAGSPAQPINVTGPEVYSVRAIANRFAAHFGRTARFVGPEADTALLINAAKSHRLFGPPATSIEQMVQWIAAWLSQGGETWGKPTGYEIRDGRY